MGFTSFTLNLKHHFLFETIRLFVYSRDNTFVWNESGLRSSLFYAQSHWKFLPYYTLMYYLNHVTSVKQTKDVCENINYYVGLLGSIS